MLKMNDYYMAKRQFKLDTFWFDFQLKIVYK